MDSFEFMGLAWFTFTVALLVAFLTGRGRFLEAAKKLCRVRG